MADGIVFGDSKVPKFTVTCKTCRITETFYSELNVSRFKSNHLHHEVLVELPQKKGEEVLVEPLEGKSRADMGPTRGPPITVAKLLVDTRLLSLQAQPVFLVQGFRSDERTAFVLTFTMEEAKRLIEFLASGRHEERGFSVFGSSEAVFTWDPGAIEFTDEARQRLAELGLKRVETPPSPAGVAEVEPPVEARPEEPMQEEAREPSSAPTLRAEPPSAPVPPVPPRPEVVAKEAPTPPTLPEVPPPPPEAVASSLDLEPEVQPAAVVKETPPPEPKPPPAVIEKPVQPHAPPPIARPQGKPERQQKRAREPEMIVVPKERKGEPEGLLLAKSWYIQDGEENMKEAARISKVLKAFRWNIEPVYTIGVILDDNMSIETNKTEISGTLVRRIEAAGYRLSALTTTTGKPTAWFKKVTRPLELSPGIDERVGPWAPASKNTGPKADWPGSQDDSDEPSPDISA